RGPVPCPAVCVALALHPRRGSIAARLRRTVRLQARAVGHLVRTVCSRNPTVCLQNRTVCLKRLDDTRGSATREPSTGLKNAGRSVQPFNRFFVAVSAAPASTQPAGIPAIARTVPGVDQELIPSTSKPYWAKLRSVVRAVPIRWRSIRTKLVASVSEKFLSL